MWRRLCLQNKKEIIDGKITHEEKGKNVTSLVENGFAGSSRENQHKCATVRISFSFSSVACWDDEFESFWSRWNSQSIKCGLIVLEKKVFFIPFPVRAKLLAEHFLVLKCLRIRSPTRCRFREVGYLIALERERAVQNVFICPSDDGVKENVWKATENKLNIPKALSKWWKPTIAFIAFTLITTGNPAGIGWDLNRHLQQIY